jgi:uncharacterized damage-inducible protein DinB
MNLQDLQTLLDYHYWARDRLLDALEALTPEQYNRDLGSSFKSIGDTVTHIYAAEHVWHLRWQGSSPDSFVPRDRVPDVAALRQAWADGERGVRALVDGLGDSGIQRVVEFTLMNGTPSAASMWQMVQHVVNHASYHRGQITTMLRQIGAPPPKAMDLIAYYRAMAAEVRPA